MTTVSIPSTPYTDPWTQSLSERLAMLSLGNRRIAYFYEAANNSTFRYRAYNMVQVLNAGPSEEVSASYFFLSDYAYFDQIADCADTLVICRSRYNAALSQLIAKFRARRRLILFDIDDLVFDPGYTRMVVSTLGLNVYDDHVWDDWFAMISRLGAAMKLCDGAITTNDFLAARIAEYSGLPTQVVPNFLNREQMEISDKVYAARSANGFTVGDRITLGYFSGSPSHRLDYAICEAALSQVMTNDDRVDLVVVGYIEPTGALKRMAHRIQKFPFQDYVNLQRVIGSVDFNLVPLQTNVFTDCKSELKIFDAAAVGTISIASPSHTYRSVVKDGINGYLSQAHEWQSVIENAIAASDCYPEMARAARGVVNASYSWDTQRNAILQALGCGR
jgi:glycosyltransferase involved in cell wall biosynthesis